MKLRFYNVFQNENDMNRKSKRLKGKNEKKKDLDVRSEQRTN